METPPPYNAPRKSGGSKLWIWILLGVGFCCILPIGLFAGGGLWLWNNTKGLVGCTINFGAVKEGMNKYVAAHDGKLPNKDTWQTDIAPYVQESLNKIGKDMGPFKAMSGSGDWGCSEGETLTTGMAFNADLSGKKLGDVKDRSTALVFETTNVGKNLSAPYKPLDPKLSPKAASQPRGWLFISVGGDLMIHGEKGDVATSTVNIKTETK